MTHRHEQAGTCMRRRVHCDMFAQTAPPRAPLSEWIAVSGESRRCARSDNEAVPFGSLAMGAAHLSQGCLPDPATSLDLAGVVAVLWQLSGRHTSKHLGASRASRARSRPLPTSSHHLAPPRGPLSPLPGQAQRGLILGLRGQQSDQEGRWGLQTQRGAAPLQASRRPLATGGRCGCTRSVGAACKPWLKGHTHKVSG